MSRHLWSVIKHEKESIWVDWIARYRLRDASIWTVNARRGAWSWRKMLELQGTLLPHIQLKIGTGESFSLWHDPWHDLGPLILRFPRGPQLTGTAPMATLSVVIADNMWNWPLITDIAYLEIIQNLPPIHTGRDVITWDSTGGDFTNVAAYHLFRPPGPTVDTALLLSEDTSDFNGLMWSGDVAFCGPRPDGEVDMCSNNSNAPAAMVDEGEEGEIEDRGHGAVLAALAMVPAVDEGEDAELQVGSHGAVSAAPTTFRRLKAGHGGLRPVRSRQATPYPPPKVLRPARRFPRWPTAEQATLAVNSAAPPSCTVELQKILSPWALHRPLAAAAGDALTAAPSVFKKSPRFSALLNTPTPFSATSIDNEESLLPPRPFHAPEIHPIWASSPSISDVSKVKPPSVDSMFDLKGPSHHQSPAVLSPPTFVVQSVVAGAPPPSWDREELPQQRTAAAPLPA
ncbi:hypothetical protein Sango_2743100 [Sesamum angolense]|uniref:Reverse transcriptase zinc-binding domain-containing protein n=1 Tax=Sesamum angolense TaxID=2727404 RepID=A0AAE1T9Q7_9LAMI|nr:hypothetical protein Sango_2743100 [Sesamum angolense]